ncbi:MAG TPA: transcriptional repressor LexA [Herpetosiphon sp.]|uniref:LexA repressor n=1 Tax=Herpetosiphon aurantiacus (strain ATCC 23779 / DSM 785 / 114-95) TaxID=316274 RepID=LEXA_HERA2|nr:transcriptional repressor LexA [Herpetosiphon sp.]A9B5H8.1 RecName: Full=LexA repressor [Herpetosiphon aurantiacus DSM 785]ABX02803.1 transcriptional repressor, LexA family [Herpetosiphon aurantiacus DSM 785]HBW49735.1 transcriptional repressor LexA [Herpetosiphon sp.]
MSGLSQRQQRIYDYIKQFIRTNGYAPAIRDIQRELSISSTSVVAYNLRALESKGHIRREGNISRAIELINAEQPLPTVLGGQRVPVLGVIAAGQPIPVPNDSANSDDSVLVPEEIVGNDKLGDVYALRVKGYSMVDALIADGDIVLLRYQATAENGEMVAARIRDENEVTLKRIYWEGDRVRLQPANVTMEAMYYPSTNVEVQGRVVGVIRNLG